VRAATRTLAAVAAAALALTGCSLKSDSSASKTATAETGPVQVDAPVSVRRTKVNVVEGLGRSGGFDASAIYRRLSPGVVTVIADMGAPGGQGGLGSGFVIDGQGFVVTNAHVVRGDPPKLERPSAVYVSFPDGNRVPARIIGDDLNADVALLKIDPAGLTLTPLRLGSSAHLVVGSPVAAIGSPFGQDQSLSVGVISALNRDIDSLTQFKIGNAIQTDAAINHGNSGGPLLDAHGRVIGINSQIESTGGGGEGVGFAVPADIVRRSIALLRTKGHVDYAYLGVSTEDLYPQLARRLGYPVKDGALVATVEQGGPAGKGGLQAGKQKITFEGQQGVPVGGDAIVAVDGRPIHRSADLTNVVALREPGQRITIELLRGKSRRKVTVTLAKRPDKPAATAPGK
jgi:S1-C subfamily serine protease